MDFVAIVLQLAFIALAFGLRTYLHARKTGSTGFRANAARSSAELFGAGGITVAAIASLIATVLAAVDVIEPLSFLDYTALRWTGAIIAGAALVLVLAAQSNMGASWRIGVDPAEKTDLVTGGLFSLTRNPIFLGMLLFWAGMCLLVPNLLSFAAFAIALAAVEVQVRMVEEPYLARTHGDAYRAYTSRTGRLVPGLGRIRNA